MPVSSLQRMGNDFHAVLFLALLSVLAFALVLVVRHDKRAEQGAAPVRV